MRHPSVLPVISPSRSPQRPTALEQLSQGTSVLSAIPYPVGALGWAGEPPVLSGA